MNMPVSFSIAPLLPRRRGRHALLSPLMILSLLVGCSDGEQSDELDAGAVEEVSVVVEADKSRILEEERNLSERRETIEAEQERLARERAEIGERLASLSKKDKSQREKLEADERRLQQEQERLGQRMRSFEEEREKLEREKSKLLEKISKLEAGKGSGGIEQREESMAQRERDVARREADLARREKEVAGREAEVARSLRDAQQLLASLGAVSRAPAPAPAPAAASAGGTTTAASVNNQRKQIARKMDARGILMEDLPPTARDLDQTARSALKSKDYAAASAALAELEQAVDATTINRAFVDGKMMRVNRTYAGKKLDGPRNGQLEKLLSEFNEAASDGRWDRANQKINQMLTVYQGK